MTLLPIGIWRIIITWFTLNFIQKLGNFYVLQLVHNCIELIAIVHYKKCIWSEFRSIQSSESDDPKWKITWMRRPISLSEWTLTSEKKLIRNTVTDQIALSQQWISIENVEKLKNLEQKKKVWSRISYKVQIVHSERDVFLGWILRNG